MYHTNQKPCMYSLCKQCWVGELCWWIMVVMKVMGMVMIVMVVMVMVVIVMVIIKLPCNCDCVDLVYTGYRY